MPIISSQIFSIALFLYLSIDDIFDDDNDDDGMRKRNASLLEEKNERERDRSTKTRATRVIVMGLFCIGIHCK